ncbi:MAG: glycosyltransferase family 8 protein [Anaerococcus sp.]|nr:glycosyltransferase family 8 protein [Anaerococcus sp.]
MNILITLDRNYLGPLRIMLASMFINNPNKTFDIYLIADGFLDADYQMLDKLTGRFDSRIKIVDFDKSIFGQAPSLRYYSRAMYYRLLAADLLPKNLDRILYLDPDILLINKIDRLYNIDFSDNLFAGASHTDSLGIIDTVNKIRLSNYNAESYFNSGVLMMNLKMMRKLVEKEDVFAYIKDKGKGLLLPDQDALNALYGHKILAVDDSIYNYDTRHFRKHLLNSKGVKNFDWISKNTVILHYCGKNKPWHEDYIGYFALIYKHYQKLVDLYLA